MAKDKYPRYFIVDDVAVSIDIDTIAEEVYGTVMLTGAPYPIFKAIAEGNEVTEEEAIRAAEVFIKPSGIAGFVVERFIRKIKNKKK